jgi:hypothetical protein
MKTNFILNAAKEKLEIIIHRSKTKTASTLVEAVFECLVKQLLVKREFIAIFAFLKKKSANNDK